MESTEKNGIVILRLFKNEDLNQMIKKACEKHNIKTGIVISGIGQLKSVTLGYFKEKDNYTPQKFTKRFELLSLSGNICKDEKENILHLHAVLGNEKKETIGGHFIDGEVSITGEIAILKLDIQAKRVYDEETGLKNLSIQ